jgi:hypothetical protein
MLIGSHGVLPTGWRCCLRLAFEGSHVIESTDVGPGWVEGL